MVLTARRKTSLAVCHTLVNRHIGGAERHILDLCRVMRVRGHHPGILLASNVPLEPLIYEMGITLREIPPTNDIDPRTPFRVSAGLSALEADILNVHDNAAAIPCCLGGRLARVPVVATVHAFHEKWPFVAADHLIAVSEALRTHLLGQGFPANRVTLVRNGVDLNHFIPGDREQARRNLELDPDRCYFIFLGRLAQGKGIGKLLEIFRRLHDELPRTGLLIVGNGPQSAELQQYVSRHALEQAVRFFGYCESIRPALTAADCLVLPSAREGLGLVLLEAMACARAAIATDAGGPREVIRSPETGYLVPPDNSEALYAAMHSAALNPSWREDAGLAGRRCAEEHHSLETQVDGIEAVYQQLLQQ